MHVDFPLTPTSLQNTIRRLLCSLFTRLLPTGGSHLTSHRKWARSGKQFSLDYPKYRLSFSSWRHTDRIRTTHAHLWELRLHPMPGSMKYSYNWNEGMTLSQLRGQIETRLSRNRQKPQSRNSRASSESRKLASFWDFGWLPTSYAGPWRPFAALLCTFGARHKESYSPLPLITGGYFLE
ncbi:hypothetical protein CCUS01_10863 [Colletotrichum cuscutae]|uniref:Uncharacterized protein n=1 Tax=Colletotrichum cuscutae TaxID=1209917 RepID=A0AAI9U934_9PEZI|nr:hypothetical protein CCUS01_10863 [Colletotrichum cuscutae]